MTSESKRSRTVPNVSLFPFLSVLACVMGTLTVLIAGLAVGQMDTSWIDRSNEFVRLKDELATEREEESKLKRLIAEAADIRKRITDAREEAKRLEDQLPHPLDDVRTALELLEASKSQREEIEKLEKLLNQLVAQLSEISVNIKNGKVRPKDAILVMGSSGGVGKGLRPSFVECRSDGLVVHSPVSKRGEIRSVATDFPKHVAYIKQRNQQIAEADSRSRLGEVIGQDAQDLANANNETWSIVFLIRADGVAPFQSALPLVLGQEVEFGYLPLPGDGPIDFSLWDFDASRSQQYEGLSDE